MDTLKFDITTMGKLSRYNGFENANDFLNELQKHINVVVLTANGSIYVTRKKT